MKKENKYEKMYILLVSSADNQFHFDFAKPDEWVCSSIWFDLSGHNRKVNALNVMEWPQKLVWYFARMS